MIGICAGAMSAATLVMLLRSTEKSGATLTSFGSPLLDSHNTDSAAMYGALHLFVSIANLVSLSVISSMIQYRASAHMRSGLESGYLESNPGVSDGGFHFQSDLSNSIRVNALPSSSIDA